MFGFFKKPLTIQTVDVQCAYYLEQDDYQKAAQIAQRFRDKVTESAVYEVAEQCLRIGIAYYWIAKAANVAVELAAPDTQGLLRSFFAAHYAARFYLQKAIMRDFVWDESHPVYPRIGELDRIYGILRDVYGEQAEQADNEANESMARILKSA